MPIAAHGARVEEGATSYGLAEKSRAEQKLVGRRRERERLRAWLEGLKTGRGLALVLRGVGIWALGYDGARTELYQALEDKFIKDAVPPTITGSALSTSVISPNGDGRLDSATASLTATAFVRWGYRLQKLDGTTAGPTIRSGTVKNKTPRWTWNGKDADGKVVRDGRYRIALWVEDLSGNRTAKTFVVTVDTPVLGQRERDVRNGLILPPRITARNVLDTLRRPAWLRDFLTHPRPTFGNFVGIPGVEHDAVSLAAFTTKQFSASIGWADVEWYRSLWPGPIALKGIMSAEDAREAVERGIEAVIISNHGGRQLDHAPAPIEVLPEIVEAVDGRAEVILDGGVRRGTDVVKALALGARACMVGKAFNYGVAALGGPGVELAIDILQREIDRALALVGRPTLAQLDRSAVQLRAEPRRTPAAPPLSGGRA